MLELTISGQVYKFKFGIGFLREMNAKVKVPVDNTPGLTKGVGFRYAVGGLYDGDVEELLTILDVANKGQEPRVTKAELESYIDSETTDIDELFKEVMDFLSEANATKKEMQNVQKLIDEQEEKKKQNQ